MEFSGHRRNLILIHIRTCGTAQSKKPVAKIDFKQSPLTIVASSLVAVLDAKGGLKQPTCNCIPLKVIATSSARPVIGRAGAKTGFAFMGSHGTPAMNTAKIQQPTFRLEAEMSRWLKSMLARSASCQAIAMGPSSSRDELNRPPLSEESRETFLLTLALIRHPGCTVLTRHSVLGWQRSFACPTALYSLA